MNEWDFTPTTEGQVFAGVLKAGGILLAIWFLLSLLL